MACLISSMADTTIDSEAEAVRFAVVSHTYRSINRRSLDVVLPPLPKALLIRGCYAPPQNKEKQQEEKEQRLTPNLRARSCEKTTHPTAAATKITTIAMTMPPAVETMIS